MKTTRIIEEIYGEKPSSTEYIPTGLTNKNTIVTLKDSRIVLREPKPENMHLFNYKNEASILGLVKSLDAPLLYFNEETGIKVSEYIPNTEVYQEKYLLRAAALIKQLHDLKAHCEIDFNITDSFNSFQTKNSLYDLSPYTHFLSEAQEQSDFTTLCHNDLVQGNFLFSDNRDYLIDYEYATNNDPFFDIMSFITENDIQDSNQREAFYEVYFGHIPTLEDRAKLRVFELAHYVLWCQWACMMYDLYKETVYKDIADLKYKRLKETI